MPKTRVYKIVITRHIHAENQRRALARVIKQLAQIVKRHPFDFEGYIDYKIKITTNVPMKGAEE